MRREALKWLDDARPTSIDKLRNLSGRIRWFSMRSWLMQRCRGKSRVIQEVDVNTADLYDYCSREIEDPLHSRFTPFPKLEVIQCES